MRSYEQKEHPLMSQEHPTNPNQPQQPQQPYSQPQYPQYGQQTNQPTYQGPAPYQPPQKPKKKGAKIAGFGCLGVIALFVIIGIATSGGSDDSSTTADTSAAAPETPAADAKDKPADKPAAPPKRELSQADQFKAFVAKNGTPTEKTAVGHVTKVQGADQSNGILDTVDVYTDYSGGMMGTHAADGKLVASAFADWKTSKNGLVTVYDAKGEILSNGNF